MKFRTMWTKTATPGKVFDSADKVDRVNCLDPKKQLEQIVRTGEAAALSAVAQLPYDVEDLKNLDDLDMKNLSTLGLVRKLSNDFSNRHVCKVLTEKQLGESLRDRFKRKMNEKKTAEARKEAMKKEILAKAAEITRQQVQQEEKKGEA